ncbi:MAG: hypothetical protein AAF337_03185 [Pseudomonadota bacterium]
MKDDRVSSTELREAIRQNIVDVHLFFMDWFAGRLAPEDLEPAFLSQLDDRFFYIPPSGALVPKAAMADMFRAMHGADPALEIDIEDVALQHAMGTHALVTYREVQRGSVLSDKAENERLTTLLITTAQPFCWLSVHETWIDQAG